MTKTSIDFAFPLSAGSSPPTPKGEKVAAALTVGCSVAAHGRNTLEFCLAWDMPQITFGSREKEHVRYMWGLYFGGVSVKMKMHCI